MPDYTAVVNVTNCFNAATKLRSMDLGDVRSGTAIKSLYNSPELLGKALKTIADALPADKFRSDVNLYDNIDKGTTLLSTYHQLNSRINKSRSSGFKADDIIEIARIIKPVAHEKDRKMIDKLLQIYEIINN